MFISGVSLYKIRKAFSDAAIIAKCDGGYMVFFNRNDYITWRKQK